MRSGRPHLASAFVCLAYVALCRPAVAAPGLFDGAWSATEIAETYKVVRWPKACGAAPTSGTVVPAGTVNIQQVGDELVFTGPGARTFRTDQCIDTLSTLSRDAHSRDPSGRSWRTRCGTPAGDTRHAVMNTLVVATTDLQIDLLETGRYDGVSNDGPCVADVTRSGKLTAVPKVQAPVASAEPTPLPAPAATQAPRVEATPKHAVDCSSPGEPVRFELTPSVKLLRSGEAFQFHAVPRDASGCPARAPVKWSVIRKLGDGVLPAIDQAGKFSSVSDAPYGKFDVVASVGTQTATAHVEVTSPALYDELLAQSGLGTTGESAEPVVTLIPPGTIGSAGGTAVDGSGRKKIFIAIIAALCSVFGLVAAYGMSRARRAARLAKEAEERHQELLREHDERQQARIKEHNAQMQAHLESLARAKEATEAMRARGASNDATRTCPTCRREFPGTSTFCPHDGTRLASPPPVQQARPGPAGLVCPACRRGFEAGVRVCPDHKEELVPLQMLTVAQTQVAPAVRVKICPSCGGRSEGPAAFCGKDGTALVPLN